MEVSVCTQRNWERLGTNTSTRLRSRANKTQSTKRFVPTERCSNPLTGRWIENIISIVLNKEFSIQSVLYTFILNLFSKHAIQKKAYTQFLEEYSDFSMIDEFAKFSIPDEFDILGTFYQAYLSEGEKNKKGSYYTPKDIVEKMLYPFKMHLNSRFYDPCCGSGAFLLCVNGIDPNNIYGTDIDAISIMIAKANLLIKYKDYDYDFYPHLYVKDFLQEDLFSDNFISSLGEFDFIATNPPWGAISNVVSSCSNNSKETSSLFLIKSFSMLRKEGCLNFLLPISILNVKAHKDIREFLLHNGRLENITLFDKLFSGVTTKYVSLLYSKKERENRMSYTDECCTKWIDIDDFYKTDSLTFTFTEDIDTAIIRKIKSKGNLNLRNSEWALGIVTGDNKNKLHSVQGVNEEPIYTGKEINAYKLAPAKYYISFDVSTLQQVAKEKYYRAKEKLVYKFISKKLVFAYDDTGSLFLNSANILIPQIEGMSIKSVLAFLNSPVFQYLYIKLFDEIKILKGNLMELPFPNLSHNKDALLIQFVDKVLNGNEDMIQTINEWIYSFYDLTKEEKEHIYKIVYGKVK